jgi:hypothetical protein
VPGILSRRYAATPTPEVRPPTQCCTAFCLAFPGWCPISAGCRPALGRPSGHRSTCLLLRGEGIAEAFMGWVEQDTGEFLKNGEQKKKKMRCQMRHNAFFVADEGGGVHQADRAQRLNPWCHDAQRVVWRNTRPTERRGGS